MSWEISAGVGLFVLRAAAALVTLAKARYEKRCRGGVHAVFLGDATVRHKPSLAKL